MGHLKESSCKNLKLKAGIEVNNTQFTREYAQSLDKENKGISYRDEFYIPEGTIYMDGNSLGLASKRSEQTLFSILDSWKTYAIDGWLDGDSPWYYFSQKLAEMSAPLVGAEAHEVIITGSTTSNIHQVISTLFQPGKIKNKILADELNFPSDIYALKSQLQLHGLDPDDHLVQVKSRDSYTLDESDIVDAMTEEIAMILLPSVLYRSGQILDMKYLTEEAHKRNILIGFDLCHSIGAIPHELKEWDVDFAVWCTYKYLNGGPGSVAGLYVNEKHLGQAPGLAGWFSSDKRKQFDMEHELTPAKDAGAFQMGTPHMLSAAPLLGSLSIFNEVGMDLIRKNSLKKTAYMMMLIDEELSKHNFKIANPREDDRRGGHVFLVHEEAVRICKALKENKIIPDFRNPNGIRFAPIALYNTFEDIWVTVHTLKKIMEEKQYEEFSAEKGIVT